MIFNVICYDTKDDQCYISEKLLNNDQIEYIQRKMVSRTIIPTYINNPTKRTILWLKMSGFSEFRDEDDVVHYTKEI